MVELRFNEAGPANCTKLFRSAAGNGSWPAGDPVQVAGPFPGLSSLAKGRSGIALALHCLLR